MQNYALGANAVLSTLDGETTDNLIASAIDTLPKSAVSAVMPVVKTKGPTSQWVEPYYTNNKLQILASPVTMYNETSNRKNIRFSCNAVEDIMRMYKPESFMHTLHNWILFQKNSKQRDELVKVLQSAEVDGIAPDSEVNGLINPTVEDNYEIAIQKIMETMARIQKDHQLGDVPFSVCGPYELLYPVYRANSWMRQDRINFFGDDRLTKIYVFPTGDNHASRAGLCLFEYADEVQKSLDSETGDLSYWVYSRSTIVVNPIHSKTPLIRNITIN